MRIYLALLLLTWSLFSHAAEPLPASEIFIPTARAVDANTLQFNIEIKPGYFLYRDRIKIQLLQESDAQLGVLILPSSIIKKDKSGHQYAIYRNHLKLLVPLLGSKPGTTDLKVHYQGCADSGFCYPPIDTVVTLKINSKLGLSQAKILSPNTATPEEAPPKTDSIKHALEHDNLLLTLLSFYGFGLLLAFTPCVLPMVPILSGMILGHGQHLGSKKAFMLSLIYVLSMSFAYALVGVIIAAIGANIQLALQTTWANIIFGAVFVLLALSMFGFYDLEMPVSWQTKFASLSRSQHGGAYLGVAVMGALSTLILSPCVTAPLVGALGFIANTGNILTGSLTLFALGLGMGTPLLLIGSSAGKLLPKAGSWMNSVKEFFGVLLLAVAIDIFSRMLPAVIVMILWAALLMISGIFLGALRREHDTNHSKFWQGCGLILLLYGAVIIVGACMGNRDPLQPLVKKSSGSSRIFSKQLIYHKVTNLKDTLQAIAEAETEQRPAMLDFYATWCTACVWMEHTTFTDPLLVPLLAKYSVIKVDISANNDESKELLNYFNVIAPPTFIFFNSDGTEIKSARIVGEQSAPELYKHLKDLDTQSDM